MNTERLKTNVIKKKWKLDNLKTMDKMLIPNGKNIENLTRKNVTSEIIGW